MIATLRGKISEKLDGKIVIDCGGVGYGVIMRFSDYDRLSSGTEIKVYVYEHIKEDAHDLFGFINPSDKQLFEQLISVKNVGPKVGMNVLDIGSSDDVRSAIADGDVKRLQTAKGVGKRAAEQIVVELRDKVGLASSASAEGLVMRGGVNLADEAVQALMALGYVESDAALALENIDKTLPLEERIKLALRGQL